MCPKTKSTIITKNGFEGLKINKMNLQQGNSKFLLRAQMG